MRRGHSTTPCHDCTTVVHLVGYLRLRESTGEDSNFINETIKEVVEISDSSITDDSASFNQTTRVKDTSKAPVIGSLKLTIDVEGHCGTVDSCSKVIRRVWHDGIGRSGKRNSGGPRRVCDAESNGAVGAKKDLKLARIETVGRHTCKEDAHTLTGISAKGTGAEPACH